MNNHTSNWRKGVVAVGIVVGMVLLLAQAVFAGNPNPGVLPPDSKPYGMTYGEWNAKWWQWAYSMPVGDHPLFDSDCGQGQSGPVWFLGGTFSSEQLPTGEWVGEATRDCRVPTGKALLFPVLNVETSTLEGYGDTDEALREVAVWQMDHASDLHAEIDGVPIQDLPAYRNQSPPFEFGPLPDDNVLQWLGFTAPEGATSLAVGDGVYLMLAPLPVGEHTVHFGGQFIFTEDEDGFDFHFILDVTYHLTVAPRKP